MIEQSLIQDCINNNAAAQRELYNRFSGLFFGICMRYSNTKEDAEDMLQEGFIKIFTQFSSFENKGHIVGWMRRTMINSCINILKKNRKFNETLQLEYFPEIELKEESLASKLLGKQVMFYLLQMPLSYRVVINLHAIEGFNYKEIATMLQIEESSCRSRYMRGIDKLENILIEKNIIPSNPIKGEWLEMLNG